MCQIARQTDGVESRGWRGPIDRSPHAFDVSLFGLCILGLTLISCKIDRFYQIPRDIKDIAGWPAFEL